MKQFSLLRSFLFSIKKAPISMSIIIVFEILNGFILPLQVIFLSNFLDSTLNYLNNNGDFNTVVYWLASLMAIFLYSALGETVLNLSNLKFQHKMKIEFEEIILRKQVKLKYKYIENRETHDLIRRVSDNPVERLVSSVRSILKSIADIISIGGIILMLFVAGWQVGTMLLLVSVFVYYISNRLGRGLHNWWEKNIKYQRKYEYLSNLLIKREYATEHKMFNFRSYLTALWEKSFDKYNNNNIKEHTKALLKINLSIAFSAILKLVIYLLLLQSLIVGKITLGFYLGLARTIGNVQNYVSRQLSKRAVEISKLREYWKDVNIFLELEETNTEDRKKIEGSNLDTIEFKDVWFKYPGTEDYILKGVNLKMEEGKHYSLVGENGAGKSTLTKLLIGLYSPTKGRILINGQNISLMSYGEYISYFSIVYQDLAKYYLTARENIAFGNMDNIENEEAVITAAQKGGIHDKILQLPQEYDTILGKIQEKGTDLSGGEWQKIAISRALMADAPVTILDEPTAALDPLAEANLYKYFNDIMKDKTTFFISHRLGSTKLSEKIFVLSEGVVKESGSHESLMQLEDGIYAKMYESQKKWYIS